MNSRLLKLRLAVTKHRLDAVLVSSIPNITYLTGFSSFFKDEREAFLLITVRSKQYILTDGRYAEAVKSKIKNFELVEISAKLHFKNALKNLTKKHKIKRLGIEEENLTVKEHKAIFNFLSFRAKPRLTRRSRGISMHHYSSDSQRLIKDQEEIAAIEKACLLGDKTFDYILNKIKTGITEKQLAFEIEFFIKKNGAEISFPPIVAFGKNSAYPHHKTSDQRLKTKDLILMDFGAKVNNYCSDMTRTIFFGSASAEYKKMYQTVLQAQRLTIEQLNNETMKKPQKVLHLGGGRLKRSGSHDSPEVKSIKAKEVDKVARDYITSKGYPTIPHGLGHGIGLEVHEAPIISPKSKDTLNIGMVFTIEPGIYLPNFGGVRIEDVVVLEESHLRLLTKSSRDLIIL